MDLKKDTSRNGGEERTVETFAYTNPERGLSKAFAGWLACEPYWCRAHEHNERERGTKVCCNWLTDGRVPCARCRPSNPPTRVCYVHLYHEVDHSPILVIVHESAEQLLEGLDWRSHVLVGRLGEKASVFVKQNPARKAYPFTQPHRQRPIDIAVSLLTIWKLPHLDQWYAKGAAPKLQEVEVESPARAIPEDEYLLGDSFFRGLPREAQEAIRKRRAERNGKHG